MDDLLVSVLAVNFVLDLVVVVRQQRKPDLCVLGDDDWLCPDRVVKRQRRCLPPARAPLYRPNSVPGQTDMWAGSFVAAWPLRTACSNPPPHPLPTAPPAWSASGSPPTCPPLVVGRHRSQTTTALPCCVSPVPDTPLRSPTLPPHKLPVFPPPARPNSPPGPP